MTRLTPEQIDEIERCDPGIHPHMLVAIQAGDVRALCAMARKAEKMREAIKDLLAERSPAAQLSNACLAARAALED